MTTALCCFVEAERSRRRLEEERVEVGVQPAAEAGSHAVGFVDFQEPELPVLDPQPLQPGLRIASKLVVQGRLQGHCVPHRLPASSHRVQMAERSWG